MTKPKARTKFWLVFIAALILAGAGAVYYFSRSKAESAALETISYQTSTVQLTSLTQSATGTGSIVASQTADLNFPTSGNIIELNVDLGDKVQAGDELAKLDGINELEQEVANAKLDLLIAQEVLEDVKNGDLVIANAQVARAKAETALAQAQQNLIDPHYGRCSEETTEKYYQKYLDAQIAAEPWQKLLKQATANGQDLQYYQQNLAPLLRNIRYALINYQYCQSYTTEEVSNSKAALQVAQAAYDQAVSDYETAVENSGIDPIKLNMAEAAVKNGELQVSDAEYNLTHATLVAPISGTITALNSELGAAAPNGVFITISDLSRPELEVSMDEIDLQSFAVGCKVDVSFTSLSDILTGTVSTVDPQLESSMESTSVTGLVSLDEIPAALTLPLGLNAYVDVTCNEGVEALTVPLQAIKEDQAAAEYYVYVLNSQNLPEKRVIEPGIQTANLLEVKSGLSEGEKVITNPGNLP